MTVGELMSIADEYADAKVEDYAFHGDVKARNLRDKLSTAIEELHRDAARYRWLRDGEVSQEDQSWIAVGEFDSFGVSAIARNDLDAAIDAAMKKST